MKPLFDLHDHFDTEITIGDQQLPIHVKRYSRAEMDAFEKHWAAMTPRGSAPRTPEEVEALEAELAPFFESSIREAITLDEGLVMDRGKSVTDGAGLIAIFHARKDVLGSFIGAIYTENKLTGVIRKNWNSPRASGTGSAASIQTRGGDAPDSTAASVVSLSIVPRAAAMGVPDEDPSGASQAPI